MVSRHPSTKWAQRPDKVYLMIELPDAKDVKLSLKPDGCFNFSAKAPPDDMQYELDLELFDDVNVEESQAAVAPRTICYLIKKAEGKWWPRLLKKEGKPPVFLKVDWDKWQDEDDEDAGFGDFGDMDFSKLDIGGGDDDYDDDIEEDNEDNVVDSANKEGVHDLFGKHVPVAGFILLACYLNSAMLIIFRMSVQDDDDDSDDEKKQCHQKHHHQLRHDYDD